MSSVVTSTCGRVNCHCHGQCHPSPSRFRRRFFIPFMVTICLLLLIDYDTRGVESARYRFEIENKTQNSFRNFFRRKNVFVQNDPIQVRLDPVTPGNLFGWLNLKHYVRFRLWTRKNPVMAHELKVSNEPSVLSSAFDARRLTKIIIHGYADSANEIYLSEYLVDMRDAYLKLGDVNVIVVDYTFFAMPVLYLTSLHEVVAEQLTDLLRFLIKITEISLNSVHLIGMSWGAHVAGLSGFQLKGKIGRITGLDPAGPLFRFVDNEFRLDKSDAKFVDLIHVNGGTRILFGGHFGLRDALGHVDVYPNGGEKQIGCPMGRTLRYETLICSHARVVGYYLESISSPLAFPMCPCPDFDSFVKDECRCHPQNVSYMGEHLSHKTRGIFQLITKPKYPFGQGPHMQITLPDIKDNEIDGPEIERSSRVVSKRHNSQPAAENGTDIQILLNSEPTLASPLFSSPPESLFGTAQILYRNKSRRLQFDDEFSSSKYPNDQILKLCLLVMSEEAAGSDLINRTILYNVQKS